MNGHEEAVAKISADVRRFYEQKQPFRIFHGGTNSTRQPRYSKNSVIDTSGLKNVLRVDRTGCTASVEPNVSMRSLVKETLRHGMIPAVVMELPAITVGGGFSGNSGESSSWRHGLFDCTINAIEIVLANGEVVYASRTQNPDLLCGAAGSFGTLGVVTLLEVQLIKAQEYVELTYLPVQDASEAVSAMNELFLDDSVLYVDGILYSPTSGVVVCGRLSSRPWGNLSGLSTFDRARDPYFYLHAQAQINMQQHVIKPVTVSIEDYLFRYDRCAFWVGRYAFDYFFVPYNRVTRFLLDKFMHAEVMWHALHESDLASSYVVQDISVPVDNLERFVSYIRETLNIWPLWICPVKVEPSTRLLPVSVAQPDLKPNSSHTMFMNVGIWGFGSNDKSHFETLNRALESKARELGGAKALYARAYYTEDEFWEAYDKDPTTSCDRSGTHRRCQTYTKKSSKAPRQFRRGRRGDVWARSWMLSGTLGRCQASEGL